MPDGIVIGSGSVNSTAGGVNQKKKMNDNSNQNRAALLT